MRRIQNVYEQEPLGARFGRFVALLFVVFGVTGVVVITQRFSAETLALIVGLLLAGVPLLAIMALLGFIAVKATTRERQQGGQMMIPPIVMQLPQTSQNALTDNGGYPWDVLQRQPAARSWDVIGEE